MKNYPIYQTTLKQPVSFIGRGLHSGVKCRLTLKPCKDSSGIFFLRKDVPSGKNLIAARWYKVTDTRLSTVITNSHGVSVATVEHLMAALKICGIDNAEIEIDGPEVPIMDGSALPFVEALERIGTQTFSEKRMAIWIKRTVVVEQGKKFALFIPDKAQRITATIDFTESAIGEQTYSTNLNTQLLQEKIAPARTFGFVDQIEDFRINGLAQGGSIRNSIHVDGEKIINEEDLRFDNEFVRHKVLDAIGDLALVGMPIIGHHYSYKGGHWLNKILIQKLLNDKSSWSFISLEDFHQLHGSCERDGENKIKHTDVNVETLRAKSR